MLGHRTLLRRLGRTAHPLHPSVVLRGAQRRNLRVSRAQREASPAQPEAPRRVVGGAGSPIWEQALNWLFENPHWLAFGFVGFLVYYFSTSMMTNTAKGKAEARLEDCSLLAPSELMSIATNELTKDQFLRLMHEVTTAFPGGVARPRDLLWLLQRRWPSIVGPDADNKRPLELHLLERQMTGLTLRAKASQAGAKASEGVESKDDPDAPMSVLEQPGCDPNAAVAVRNEEQLVAAREKAATTDGPSPAAEAAASEASEASASEAEEGFLVPIPTLLTALSAMVSLPIDERADLLLAIHAEPTMGAGALPTLPEGYMDAQRRQSRRAEDSVVGESAVERAKQAVLGLLPFGGEKEQGEGEGQPVEAVLVDPAPALAPEDGAVGEEEAAEEEKKERTWWGGEVKPAVDPWDEKYDGDLDESQLTAEELQVVTSRREARRRVRAAAPYSSHARMSRTDVGSGPVLSPAAMRWSDVKLLVSSLLQTDQVPLTVGVAEAGGWPVPDFKLRGAEEMAQAGAVKAGLLNKGERMATHGMPRALAATEKAAAAGGEELPESQVVLSREDVLRVIFSDEVCAWGECTRNRVREY